MKHLVVLAAGCFLAATSIGSAQEGGATLGASDRTPGPESTLTHKKWIHGSADCESNTDPAIEVFRYDPSTFILRQNKCLSFEAPFIYVLFGKEKVLVLDTGATESAADFPLYETVQSLTRAQAGQEKVAQKEMLVIHSHSHRDHYAGDAQFKGQRNVTVVEPNSAAMIQFFAFDQWPDGEANIELGDRKLTILPTPGHQEEAISVYDPQTKWLLTGDTLYPGYVYVKHWDDYKKSIARLAAFSSAREVSAVLGAHIEMQDTPGEFYSIGTIYQPHEAPLVLTPEDLAILDSALQDSGHPKEIVFDHFIVAPLGLLQKMISNIARWIIQ